MQRLRAFFELQVAPEVFNTVAVDDADFGLFQVDQPQMHVVPLALLEFGTFPIAFADGDVR